MKFSRIKYSIKSAKQIKVGEEIFLPTINNEKEVVGGQFVIFVGVNVPAKLIIYKHANFDHLNETSLSKGFQTISE